jgi:hypothetical protein
VDGAAIRAPARDQAAAPEDTVIGVWRDDKRHRAAVHRVRPGARAQQGANEPMQAKAATLFD